MRTFAALVITLVVLVPFVSACFMLLTGYGTEQPSDPAMQGQISTTLNNLALIALGYWFGTTKSSTDKDAVINNLTKGDGK